MEENLNLNEGQEGVVDPQKDAAGATDVALGTSESENGEVATPQKEEKPAQSAEENAVYAKIRREAEQKAYAKAQDELIAKMYGESHNIHTVAEYEAAIREQEIRQQYENKDLPEDVINEIVESKKFRENYDAEQKAKEQQAQKQKDLQDFITAFPDVKPDDIPVEVWQANANGIPLRYAYADHALQLARKADAIAKANAENAKSSTGSVSGDGAAIEPDFISYEAYEKNKNNQSWVNKNFDKIMKSRAKW